MASLVKDLYFLIKELQCVSETVNFVTGVEVEKKKKLWLIIFTHSGSLCKSVAQNY